jgi:hypothetical protein
MLRRTLVLLLAAGLALGTAACGDSDQERDATGSASPSGQDSGTDDSDAGGAANTADVVAATDPAEMATFCEKTKPMIATTNETLATYYENELAIAPATIEDDLELLATAWRAHADSGSSGPIDDEPVVTAATLRVSAFQEACTGL